jgi:hypothetical protein
MRGRAVLAAVLVFAFSAGCGWLSKKQIPLTENPAAPLDTPVYNHEGWVIARGSLHNHTTYSDGCRTPEDLVKQARNEGIAVLSFNDHREGRMCASKNFCVDVGGVDSPKVGYQKYYEHISRLAADNKNPIIIYGHEVVPYLWNERAFPFLLGRGGNWHYTVYGLNNPDLYAKMPARKQISSKRETDPGLDPFVKFVNYIRDNGGFVFLAHPDIADNQWLLTAHSWSPAATDFPPKLLRLSGVAVLPEGFLGVGVPGGTWDLALFEYLAGYRPEPLWGWGEADYHCPPLDLRYGTTLFYLRSLTRDDVFNAMKTGSMVALMGQDFQDVYVTEFSVGDGKPAKEKIMLGQSVKISGPAVVRFSLNKDVSLRETRLIRNGKVIFTSKSGSFEYRDDEAGARKDPVFYRVDVEGQGPDELGKGNRLFTNPVFVDWNK